MEVFGQGRGRHRRRERHRQGHRRSAGTGRCDGRDRRHHGSQRQKAAEEIGRSAIAVACDVSNRASVAAMTAEVKRQVGPVAVLIANAGVTVFEELTEMSDADVDWVIDVSLYGVTHCYPGVAPRHDRGARRPCRRHVLAAALMAPFVGKHAPYCAAKAGIIGMILSLRADLGKYNVGASVLCPGAVQSQIHGSPRYRPAQYGGPRDAVAAMPQDVRAIGRPAVEAGQMVLNAIRNDRPVIVTDPSHRPGFEQVSCAWCSKPSTMPPPSTRALAGKA
jgi:NAD(P)-dependent dehydrogenase (short-subunit alcohol dehydrogenase family)